MTAVYVGRLARRLRHIRPDLVYANSLKAAVYGSLAARAAGVPVVWHARDRIADDYLPAAAVPLLRRAAQRLPSGVIVVSSTTLETLGRITAPSWVIQDPVPLRDVPGRAAANGLCIGMVGRIAPWKGQHVFLEAFARAFEGGSVRARLVGAPLFGEEEYARRLEHDSVALGIDRRVDFVGFREDVWSELAHMDVLVHASVIPEVVLEGMAAGRAVVATREGGPGEFIRDGIDGLLYPAGNVEALAASLARLADDEPLRARLGGAARERSHDFESAAIGEAVTEAYRSILLTHERAT